MSLPYRFQLEDVSRKSGLAPDVILLFVTRSWLRPLDAEQHLFDAEDLARIHLIRDLQEKMAVNDEAVPVILHLVDQLNRMHLEFSQPKMD